MRARGMRALDSHITCAGSGSLKFTSLEVAGRVGTSTTKSRRKSRQSSCEYASAGFSARPYPGNVGAYTCAVGRASGTGAPWANHSTSQGCCRYKHAMQMDAWRPLL